MDGSIPDFPVRSWRTWLQWLTVLAVMLLAFGLRVARPELVRFGNDQSSHYDTLRRFASGEEIPLTGPPVGFSRARLGPFHFYLYLPLFLVDGRPESVLVFTAFLHALAVGLLAGSGRDFFSFRLRLTAALLFAVSPDMVYLARDFWSLSSLPLFVALYLYLMLEFLARGRQLPLVLSLLLAGLISQLHIVGALFVLPPLTALGWRRYRLAVLAGLGLALFSYFPWCLQQIRQGLPDVLAYADLIGRAGGAEAGIPHGRALALFFSWPDWFYNYVHGYGSAYFEGPFRTGPVWLETLLFCLGLFCLLRRSRGGASPPASYSYRCLLALLFLPILLLSFLPWTLYERHLLVLFPLPFLVLAVGLDALGGRRTGSSVLILALVFFLAVPRILAVFEFYRQVDRHSDIQGELPLRDKRWVLDFAAGFLAGLSADRLIARIHPLATADTSLDFRSLARLEGWPESRQEPLPPGQDPGSLDQLIYFRDADRLRLGDPLSLSRQRRGDLHLLRVPTLLAEDALAISRDGGAHYHPLGSLPLVEAEDFRPLRLRGWLRIPAGVDTLMLSFTTNLPVRSFHWQGQPRSLEQAVHSQGETEEVLAAARLFRLPVADAFPAGSFSVEFAAPNRWYLIDPMAWVLTPASPPRSLIRNLAMLQPWAAPGVPWQQGDEGKWRFCLPQASSWFMLRQTLAGTEQWDVDWRIWLRILSDGQGGLLRLSLREADGETWVVDDYGILERSGAAERWLVLDGFQRADWSPGGDGAMDIAAFRTMEISFHPWRSPRNTREVEILGLGIAAPDE